MTDSTDSSSEEEDQNAPPKKRKASVEAAHVPKKAKVDEDEEPVKNLYVGSLSWNVDDAWLADEFKKFGEVTGSRVLIDRDTGKSRGYVAVLRTRILFYVC